MCFLFDFTPILPVLKAAVIKKSKELNTLDGIPYVLKTPIRVKVQRYAHHPTEIKATIEAACHMQFNNMWCLFQPHTYTRTIALFDEFAELFEKVDIIVLVEIYAVCEKNIFKISSESLVDEIKKDYPRKEVYFYPDFDEMAQFVYDNAEPGDLIITMGAGDINKVGEKILEIDREAFKGEYLK